MKTIQFGTCAAEFSSEEHFVAIVHGGAGSADPQGEDEKHAETAIHGILKNLSHPFLSFQFNYNEANSMTIADKVALKAIHGLEENPVFNAGLGAALQSDGVARVSASFMDNSRHKFSSVTNVSNVLHPSELAYYLQSQRFCVLDQVGAKNLAAQLQIPIANLVTPERQQKWRDAKTHARVNSDAPLGKGTVGCVAVDAKGNIAVTTSTGGVGNETVGRTGDTPTIAGNYCFGRIGVSCTGYGEQIINEAFAAKLATRVVDAMKLEDALEMGLDEAISRGYGLAAIAIALDENNKTVSWAAGSTDSYFIWGVKLPNKTILFSDFI